MYKIHCSIVAFVRSGYVNLDGGQARFAGENGYGWLRTAGSSSYAYGLYMTTTSVNPSGSSIRWYAFPLHCLYPGSA